MEEQTNYPPDGKHSMTVPKKLKKFLFLNKFNCLRAAFIMGIVGYIEFTVIAILFIAFSILNNFPDRENFGAILGSIILLNGLYLVLTGVYYGIKKSDTGTVLLSLFLVSEEPSLCHTPPIRYVRKQPCGSKGLFSKTLYLCLLF